MGQLRRTISGVKALRVQISLLLPLAGSSMGTNGFENRGV